MVFALTVRLFVRSSHPMQQFGKWCARGGQGENAWVMYCNMNADDGNLACSHAHRFITQNKKNEKFVNFNCCLPHSRGQLLLAAQRVAVYKLLRYPAVRRA